MSSSKEILSTISGSLISYLLSLFLVEYFSTYIYWFSYICPQISYLFITLFITLRVFFSPEFQNNTFKFTASVFSFVFHRQCVLHCLHCIFYFDNRIFTRKLFFFFLNAASPQIPVNQKNEIYILVVLTISWKRLCVFMFQHGGK